MDDRAEDFAQLEALVVSGRHEECRRRLDRVPPRSIQREWAAKYAQLAMRTHRSLFALKALHRFIHPGNPFEASATDSEKSTYASALLHLGAAHEALELLDSVNTERTPEALLQTAFAHFALWDYKAAIPILERFIAHPGPAPYRKLVGKVNLIAAHAYCRDWGKALPLLREAKSLCKSEGYGLLLGNCHELEAQALFFTGRYDEALAELGESRERLREQNGIYALFAEKWALFCECFRSNSPESLARLRAFREKAREHSHWETIRECDLFEATLAGDGEIFRKVIFGTPSENYRQRARLVFGKVTRSSGRYRWRLGPPTDGADTPVFDPYEPQGPARTALHDRPHLFAAFEELTADFYKPAHLTALFRGVYPAEKFNPYTSPARVLRLLRRLNGWFEEAGLPLRVDLHKSEFSLAAEQPIDILLLRGKKRTAADGKFAELKNAFPGKSFSSAKVSGAMGISMASARRLIKTALSEGKVTAVGRGRGTSYRLASRRKRETAA